MTDPAAVLVPFFNAVFSQFGATFGVLMIAVGYLVRELRDERKAHDQTTGKLIGLAEQSVRSGIEQAEAMRATKSIVEKLADRIDSRNRNDR